MENKRLTGEIAIITGSDSGIGQATAIAFAREGADVAVTYLEDRKGAEHTQQLIEETGQKALVFQLDHSQPEQVEQLFKETQDKLGTPTILVNNAAGGSVNVPVKDTKIRACFQTLSIPPAPLEKGGENS